MSMNFVIPKIWTNSTAVCIASGPSLSDEDINLCYEKRKDLDGKKLRYIVINDNYLKAPWAEILYAADSLWWKNHKDRLRKEGFRGIKISIEKRSLEFGKDIKIVKNLGIKGLSLNSRGLMTGHNSGYQAINLAVLLGVKKIILLGYDMKIRDKGKNHWFGEHNWKDKEKINIPYEIFLRSYKTIVEPLKEVGVEVINCNMDSGLDVFKKMELKYII